MDNFNDLLYSRSFSVFGVPTVLTTRPGVVIELTGIDKTAGVEITDNAIGLQVVRPAVDVRRSALGATPLTDLDGGTILINGTTWVISSFMEKPTPFGATDGLVVLLLVGNA